MVTLVTGASGFVGSAVVRDLVAAGHEVRALVRPGSNRHNLTGVPVTLSIGDVTDRASLDRALRGCTALFHVAADYRLWAPDPAVLYRVNLEGTRNIMAAATEAGVERIVYTSSVATLGFDHDGGAASEDTPSTLNDMTGHYKRSKFLAEALVQRLIRERGLPAVIVNPTTPVGPGDVRPTPTGRMVRDAACGRMPAYVDTGLNIVHVDDVAAGHRLALENGRIGERYILGGENLAFHHILEDIATIAGRPPPRIRLSRNLVLPLAYLAQAWAAFRNNGEPLLTVDGIRMSRKRMFFTSEKARRQLDYAPRPAFEALKDAVEWFGRGG